MCIFYWNCSILMKFDLPWRQVCTIQVSLPYLNIHTQIINTERQRFSLPIWIFGDMFWFVFELDKEQTFVQSFFLYVLFQESTYQHLDVFASIYTKKMIINYTNRLSNPSLSNTFKNKIILSSLCHQKRRRKDISLLPINLQYKLS